MSAVKVSRIRKVWDGDTFRCDVDDWPKLFGYNIPIRLKGIDCAEKNADDSALRDLAARATLETKKVLMNGKVIELVDCGRDKYFRVVARVLVDGVDLGSHLMSLGLAERYPNY